MFTLKPGQIVKLDDNSMKLCLKVDKEIKLFNPELDHYFSVKDVKIIGVFSAEKAGSYLDVLEGQKEGLKLWPNVLDRAVEKERIGAKIGPGFTIEDAMAELQRWDDVEFRVD